MGKTDQLSCRIIEQPGMPKGYIEEEAAHRIGPKLFTHLLGQGKTVVEVQKRKAMSTGRYFEPEVEHAYRVKLTAVQYENIVMPRMEFHEPVTRFVPPPPVPWYARVAKFIAAEWERAGTNPGVEYVP
jgi:hypothetical protein